MLLSTTSPCWSVYSPVVSGFFSMSLLFFLSSCFGTLQRKKKKVNSRRSITITIIIIIRKIRKKQTSLHFTQGNIASLCYEEISSQCKKTGNYKPYFFNSLAHKERASNEANTAHAVLCSTHFLSLSPCLIVKLLPAICSSQLLY